MMKKNQQKYAAVIICICLLVLGSFLFFEHQKQGKKAQYDDLFITFKETDRTYEINEELEPITFIQESNADEIIYPTIRASSAGEHPFVYVAVDRSGNQKEFILLLTFVQRSDPVIELTSERAEVFEDDEIDLNVYVKRAYDKEIGNDLKVKIEKPKGYKQVGTHEITYRVTSDTGKQAKAILTLVVKEKQEEQQIPDENKNNAQTTPNRTENTHPTDKPSPIITENIKNYLFSEGYTIESAPAACQADLIASGRSGQCIFLKGEDGLYTGMQLQLR